MAIELTGNWKKGLAFDVHTLDSVYIGTDDNGYDQWETTRSEMGELIYQLKYRGDQKCVPKIINLLEKIKGIDTFDVIVPIPPTNPARRWQPVTQIAEALGKLHHVKVLPKLLIKKQSGLELKNVDDPDERRELLQSSMTISESHDVSGLKILLIDDLYRSGSTLWVATELVLEDGDAAAVCVLTMTKTQSKR
ncbi:MAG: ComF family protein [Rubrobacteraceae bacterium]